MMRLEIRVCVSCVVCDKSNVEIKIAAVAMFERSPNCLRLARE